MKGDKMTKFGLCFVPITGKLEFILITGFNERILRLSKEEFGYFIADCHSYITTGTVIETNKYKIEDGEICTYTKHILNADIKTLSILLQFYKENQSKIVLTSLQETIEHIIKDVLK